MMLAQGLTIDTGIEGAIGLATDFKDTYCVAHDCKVALHGVDGALRKELDLGSRVRDVWCSNGIFQALTEEHFCWLNGHMDLDYVDRSHQREVKIKVGACTFSSRPRFYGRLMLSEGRNGDGRYCKRLYGLLLEQRKVRLEPRS